jgi:hypothetical protein
LIKNGTLNLEDFIKGVNKTEESSNSTNSESSEEPKTENNEDL